MQVMKMQGNRSLNARADTLQNKITDAGGPRPGHFVYLG